MRICSQDDFAVMPKQTVFPVLDPSPSSSPVVHMHARLLLVSVLLLQKALSFSTSQSTGEETAALHSRAAKT